MSTQGSLQAREVSAHSCGRCRRRFRFSATCRGHRQRAFACRGKERLSSVRACGLFQRARHFNHVHLSVGLHSVILTDVRLVSVFVVEYC